MHSRVVGVVIGAALGLGPLTAAGPLPATAGAQSVSPRAAPAVPRVTAVRVSAHPGFDRLAFQFAGGVPAVHSVAWVARVVQDPSGRPLALGGRALLRVLFRPATTHTESGTRTYTGTPPARFDLSVLHRVAQAGDFENVVSFGVSLWQRTTLHIYTLAAPPRLVVDLRTPRALPARLTEIDNRRLLHLHVGQATTVALRTCVSCGDTWRIVDLPAAAVVRVVSSSVVALPHAPGIVGFPYESRFVLRASGAGVTSLRLEEVPPQRGAAPIARYVLRFAVTR